MKKSVLDIYMLMRNLLCKECNGGLGFAPFYIDYSVIWFRCFIICQWSNLTTTEHLGNISDQQPHMYVVCVDQISSVLGFTYCLLGLKQAISFCDSNQWGDKCGVYRAHRMNATYDQQPVAPLVMWHQQKPGTAYSNLILTETRANTEQRS